MYNLKGSSEELTWKEARQSVADVNPEFAEIIDQLSPNNKHWLLKVRYPYGGSVMSRSVLAIPNKNGDIVPVTDDSIPKKIREGIGYNLNSNPVSVVLANSFEIFLPLEDRTVPLSGVIKPGTVFGAWRMLAPKTTEHPIFIWDMTAGARSTFMLPKIKMKAKHDKLKKEFGVSEGIPRTLMQHFEIFKQLANSETIKEPWSAEILYFSKEWFSHLDDKAWSNFYRYFQRAGWAGNEFWRNQPIWGLIFSLILKDYESRPSAYITDTVRYLLGIGVGAYSGMGVAQDTIGGPFDLIQKIYSEVYEIKDYPPIIIQPKFFDFRNSSVNPVYYSLQFPTSIEFKHSSRMRANVISDLHEIRSLLIRYERELVSGKFNIDGTSLMKLFDHVVFDYFHSGVDLHSGMKDSAEMCEDKNLRTTIDGVVHDAFPSYCSFGKGCVRLSSKQLTDDI